MAPLSDLTCGSKKSKSQPIFMFSEKAYKIFVKLKEHFTSTSILVHHNPKQHICVKLDASGFVVAVILLKLCDNRL